MTTTRQAAEHEPVARVLPMLSVPHLDRDFDYLVPWSSPMTRSPAYGCGSASTADWSTRFILERRSDTDHVGKLGWLDRVVSAERVLTPDVRRLVDAVAARYAGTRADVLRLAIPPRHANVEKQASPELPVPSLTAVDRTAWASLRGRRTVPRRTRRGPRAARAVWQALPGEPGPIGWRRPRRRW